MNLPRTKKPKRFCPTRESKNHPAGDYTSGIKNTEFAERIGFLIGYWPHVEEAMFEVVQDLLGGSRAMPSLRNELKSFGLREENCSPSTYGLIRRYSDEPTRALVHGQSSLVRPFGIKPNDHTNCSDAADAVESLNLLRDQREVGGGFKPSASFLARGPYSAAATFEMK
jgi:hypothetical protein